MKKVVCPSCGKHDSFWVNDSELIDDFDAIYKNEKCDWKTGEEVMEWWLGDNLKRKECDGQCSFFGD